MTERQSWDSYFTVLAEYVASRAACTRRQVGAVIVDPQHRIVSTGYNGTPAGAVHCTDGGCPRGRLTYEELPAGGSYANCCGVHAEANAIAQAESKSCPTNGATIFVTHAPCDDCAAMIERAGISRTVYPKESDV